MSQAIGRPERGYGVAVWLGAIYALNFMDRQLVSILAEPIKADLKLSDTQVGMLSGLVFALFYTVLAIPVARLADRGNRVRIVAVCCGIWSAFTLASGLAVNFAMLAAARIGVAMSEAGGAPPSYSVLADYFPPNRRAMAMAIYSLGVPAGVMSSALFGGWLAAHFGWRAAFLVIGGVSLLVAPLLPFVVREPVRGALDIAPNVTGAQAPSLRQILAFFARSPILLLTCASAGLAAFSGFGLLVWTPPFLIRDAGMSMIEIALYFGPVSGISLALGTWLGGWLTDRLSRHNPSGYALIPACAALLSIPFLVLALNAGSWQAALALFAVPLTLAIAYIGPTVAVIQNHLPADARATGSAILGLCLNLIGLGGGPLYVGVISDALEPSHGTAALGLAMHWLVPVLLLTALCQFGAARALRLSSRSS